MTLHLSSHMRHEHLMYGDVKLFAGTACPDLAEKIARYLKLPLSGRDIITFPNDNLFVKLHGSVRGQDCFVIQTTSAPVHRNLMELLILIQTLRLDSAARITAVVPYLAYARSDKKDQPRVPITARLVCDMIEVAGADRYITMDLHAGQIQGFFSIPCDHLTATTLFAQYMRAKGLASPVAVATDAGAAKRALSFARALQIPLAIMEKHRHGNTDTVAVTAFIGDVRGREAIVFEDEISTGSTLLAAAEVLQEQGAAAIYVCATHAVFAGDALERLQQSAINEVVVTNTIPHKDLPSKITELSVAPLLAEAIQRVTTGESISSLFEF